VNHLPLGAGPEFDRIRAIQRELGGTAWGLGDDCAILPPGRRQIVVSTDLSVEGVHFRRDWLSLEEIGWRAAAGALSDLAAEGASAVGVLASVGAPAGTDAGGLAEVMHGVGAAAARAGARVLGGDLSSAPQLVVDIVVIGRAARPVRRTGAQPGDGLWVTGTLGGARAALEAWRADRVPGMDARNRFAHPEPRLAAGRWLARHGAKAMIDLSDGLAGDARHLAAASGVRVEIDLAQVPLGPDVPEAAAAIGEPAHVFAARGGEDYELLVAMPPEFGGDMARRLRRSTGVPLSRIGRVSPGEGIQLAQEGVEVDLHGFDHFR
jgi:thiamine-monophosphate kinase